MIKTRINNEYKDIIKIFGGGTLQKEIIKVWSGEAQEYVYESSVEYTGSLPITIRANGDALLDYRIYGASGGVGEPAENGEPAGYKLPMTVYKQEFMVTGDMLDQSNWTLSPHFDYAPSYFIYFDISDFISKSECDVKIYKNFTQNYTPQQLVVALTDDIYMTVDTNFRILNNNGVILNKKFDFLSWTKIYLCIGYGYGYKNEGDKQLKINELFENWKILIAPTSQTRESTVYIGENQLAENEYVSFSDQKIYKDVSGTLTPTDPPVPLPDIPTIDGTTIIDYDGDPKPSQMYVKYRR